MLTFTHTPGTLGNIAAAAAYEVHDLDASDMVTPGGDVLAVTWEMFAPSVGDIWSAVRVDTPWSSKRSEKAERFTRAKSYRDNRRRLALSRARLAARTR
jgi:hypothetical protein